MKHYETIQSYEDACTYLSIDPNDLPVMSGPEGERLVAQIKLERITRAINEDKPIPDNHDAYVPYRILCTRKEMQAMSPDSPAKLLKGFLAGLGAFENIGSYAGLAYLHAYNRVSVADASWGFRLCFIDRDACEYAVKQFAELYDILTFND
jgi:hypothetical protein